MASGIGVNGGPGRCYGLWLDFSKCMGEADLPSECSAFRDDYIECLHHFKEFRRSKRVHEESVRQEKERAAAAAAKKKAPPAAAAAPESS